MTVVGQMYQLVMTSTKMGQKHKDDNILISGGGQ